MRWRSRALLKPFDNRQLSEAVLRAMSLDNHSTGHANESSQQAQEFESH